jgi:hypothetical protein
LWTLFAAIVIKAGHRQGGVAWEWIAIEDRFASKELRPVRPKGAS